MKYLYYDRAIEKLNDLTAGKELRIEQKKDETVFLGKRTKLEMKIMREEIERGTFEIEEWKKE